MMPALRNAHARSQLSGEVGGSSLSQHNTTIRFPDRVLVFAAARPSILTDNISVTTRTVCILPKLRGACGTWELRVFDAAYSVTCAASLIVVALSVNFVLDLCCVYTYIKVHISESDTHIFLPLRVAARPESRERDARV